jgi:DNA-binding beta-propeller fold protein YncE
MRRVVATLAIVCVSLLGCSASPPVARNVDRIPSPSPSIKETVAGPPVGRAISIGNEPGELAFTRNEIWVSSVQSLIKLDRRTLRVLSRIDIGRFDPAFIGGGSDVVASPDGVWVTCACSVSDDPRFPREPTGGFVLIDPESSRSLKTRVYTDRTPTSIAVDRFSIWLSTERTLRRLDRRSLQTTSSIRFDRYIGELSVCCGSVWAAVSNEKSGFVARVDSGSGRAIARIPVAGVVDDIVASADGVWVVSGKLLHRVDPHTNMISASVALEEPGFSVAIGAGSVWVVAFHAGTLTRIDSGTLRVISVQNVGDYPAHVSVADGSVWVVNYLPGTLRKISYHTR